MCILTHLTKRIQKCQIKSGHFRIADGLLKTIKLVNLSMNLFCLLFMEFISLNVRRLCFLRNFHTVHPHNCTSLHSLQPCRRFPDLQAPSVFMILLVGFLLMVILTGMRSYIPVALLCISYCLAVVSIFLFPPAHGKQQAACPASAAVGHRLSLPTACGVFLDQG